MKLINTPVPRSRNPLRLNVGFLINLSVGESRDFLFDIPNIHLDPDVDPGDLTGVAHIARTSQGLLVQVKMQATLLTECVRCLTNIQHPLNIDFTELYFFSRDSVTDSDLLLPEDAHIDLSPLVREYMLLDIPISPLCNPDCKGLCPICGQNLDDSKCNHEIDTIDSRLAILQTLIEKK